MKSLSSSLIFCFFIFFSFFTNAYDIRGRLVVESGDVSTWTEGEIKNATFTIWPLQEVDENYLNKELLGKTFLEFFYVSKVKNVKFSNNNPEALEVELDLILTKMFEAKKPSIWSYKGLNVPVVFENIKFIKNQNVTDFFIFNTKYNVANYSLLMWGVIIVLVLILSYLIFRKKYVVKAPETDWINIFKEAKSREDFERLYKTKEFWVNIIGGVGPNIEKFLVVIDKHQYKKEWNEEIFDEINALYTELRESLENDD